MTDHDAPTMPAEETAEPVVLYERRGSAALITLNRPKYRNAQNSVMTYALDAAFERAVNDNDVRVLVLAGSGDHFSAGHDIGTPGRDSHVPYDRKAVIWWDHTDKAGADARYAREMEVYSACAYAGGRYQAVDRDGAGRVHRRRADAGLGMRPDRGLRRRVLR
jgi:enoyl-CoA hydratase